MKKLLATMCAFALVIPCVLGFAACKKDPIKVAGKAFAYDHMEIKFDSDEAKKEYLNGRTEKECIKDLEEEESSIKLSALKFTKTAFYLGIKESEDAKEYDYYDDVLYYKQSKGKITFYDDKDFKIKTDTDGETVYTTSKYLIHTYYLREFGLTILQLYKEI